MAKNNDNIILVLKLVALPDKEFYKLGQNSYWWAKSYVSFLMSTNEGRKFYNKLWKIVFLGSPLNSPPANQDKLWQDYIKSIDNQVLKQP